MRSGPRGRAVGFADAAGPVSVAPDRRAVSIRPDDRTRPRVGDVHGECRHRRHGQRARVGDRAERRRPRDPERIALVRPRWRSHRGDGRVLRPRPPTGHAHAGRIRDPGGLGPPPRLPWFAERSSARGLSLLLRRRGNRRHPRDRGNAVRGGGRQAGLPMLGRAGSQSRLRRDPRRAGGADGDLQWSGDRAGIARRGSGPRAVRRHDAAVHVPGRLRRRAAGRDGADRRRRSAAAGRARARQVQAHALRPGSRRVLPAVLP